MQQPQKPKPSTKKGPKKDSERKPEEEGSNDPSKSRRWISAALFGAACTFIFLYNCFQNQFHSLWVKGSLFGFIVCASVGVYELLRHKLRANTIKSFAIAIIAFLALSSIITCLYLEYPDKPLPTGNENLQAATQPPAQSDTSVPDAENADFSEPPLAGLLKPADDPDPPLNSYASTQPASQGQYAPGFLKVFLGNQLAATSNEYQPVIGIGKYCPLWVHRTPAGISINAIIFDETGTVAAQIVRNEYHVNPHSPEYFFLDRPDPHTLVLHGQHGEIPLSIRFLNKTSIRISGIFRVPDHPPLTVEGDVMSIGGMVVADCTSWNNGNKDAALFFFP